MCVLRRRQRAYNQIPQHHKSEVEGIDNYITRWSTDEQCVIHHLIALLIMQRHTSSIRDTTCILQLEENLYNYSQIDGKIIVLYS